MNNFFQKFNLLGKIYKKNLWLKKENDRLTQLEQLRKRISCYQELQNPRIFSEYEQLVIFKNLLILELNLDAKISNEEILKEVKRIKDKK